MHLPRNRLAPLPQGFLPSFGRIGIIVLPWQDRVIVLPSPDDALMPDEQPLVRSPVMGSTGLDMVADIQGRQGLQGRQGFVPKVEMEGV